MCNDPIVWKAKQHLAVLLRANTAECWNILLYYIHHAVSDVTGVTWFDTGLCLRPGLFSSSSSCLRLKLETPRDLTSPASLQASKACKEEEIYIPSETDSDYLYKLSEIVVKKTMKKHCEDKLKKQNTVKRGLWHWSKQLLTLQQRMCLVLTLK